jgi:hypothetical protein
MQSSYQGTVLETAENAWLKILRQWHDFNRADGWPTIAFLRQLWDAVSYQGIVLETAENAWLKILRQGMTLVVPLKRRLMSGL